MKDKTNIQRALVPLAALMIAAAFALTFTLSDYYIFNRIAEFGLLFCASQWIKKAGLLLIVMAVFYKRRSCADMAKYVLPVFALISCFAFGNFFDIEKAAETPAQEIYNAVNLFMPKWLNVALYFVHNGLIFAICALLFVRDGFGVKAKSFIYLPFAIVACMPLNVFENFFDIAFIPQNSFLRFYNFTVWHLLAILFLAGFTVGSYYFLKGKDEEHRNLYLCAAATVLLIQYHSKDSMVLGDGYNVYHTIFACIPLFICNIGVYVASLSVYLKKRVLYAISFFIHAVGALTVFVYFGKNEMSNYGIFCSYSILYFCLTHCLLFALSVLPSALGQYTFRYKDCIIPLIYYFIVIITASVASALVTSASAAWHTADGIYLQPDELLMPNYAFTQINPLPFEMPALIIIRIWNYDVNVLYILGLYAVYVALFFAFSGLYYAFLATRKKILTRVAARASAPLQGAPVENASGASAETEVAAAEAEQEHEE